MLATQIKLQLGERVRATVEDVSSNDDMIVSVHGQLIRVHNSSSQNLKKGDQLDLVVVGVNPYEFKLYSAYKQKFNRIV
ncbi:MAG: hypothetical protein BroJett040_05460 [Oligoflexia bacterium]|nr:MAG: hypothetical protein BroJett040_05460 [Oligoflexia bacterium]